jgi:MerR family redox-sensitive transcriptional activator SoxR
MEGVSIGTIAKRAGIRTSAIRYYEAAGILEPPPRRNGQRRYATDVLVQLALIGKARALGFSIAELREFFGESPEDVAASARWRTFATRRIADLDAQIARAEAMRSMLDASLACDCDTFDTCALLGHEARPIGPVQ